MFKRYFILLFVLLTPILAFGDMQLRDGCIENKKYSKDFTIDRRCYVTDEQKQQAPYNAVVALINDNNKTFCTGTIFHDNQDFLLEDAFKYETKLPVPGLFVYTAAHCVQDNKYISNTDKLKIRLQNGKEIIVTKISVGSRPFLGISETDYAVYKIPEIEQNGLPYVDIAYDEDKNGQLNVIGYGSLSIMTDKDIHEYKEAYVNFLRGYLEKIYKDKEDLLPQYDCAKLKGTNLYDDCIKRNKTLGYGLHYSKDPENKYIGSWIDEQLNEHHEYFDDGGGILTANKSFANFVKIYPLPMDDLLKSSNCYINSKTDFCQSWFGNSGGGVFKEEKLLGIVSNAVAIFGGKNHMAFLKDRDDFIHVFSKDSKDNALFLQNSKADNLNRLRGLNK